MKSPAGLIQRCEELIRGGRAGEAATLLQGLNSARLARKWRLPLANICRRSGQVALGLRLLTPLMNFDKKEANESATIKEKAEYAVLLERFGAVSESLRLLNALDPSGVPEIRLYRAFCHFKNWDYEAALPELLGYVQSPLAPYAQLVGRMNLAAAYNALDRLNEAEELLVEILRDTRAGNHRRLLANALELMSEVHIKRGHLDQAEILLNEAAEFFGDAATQDRLFVKIYQAFIASSKIGSAAPLEQLQREAYEQKHFESAREIDLLILKIEFNNERFARLCARTPFRGFHGRIARFLGIRPIGGQFTLAETPGIIPGSQPHRLLSILMKDGYKPMPVGALFSELFPQERFNIESSPNRVRQLVHRLARWGKQNGYSHSITHSGAGYQFFANGMPLKIEDPSHAADTADYSLKSLREKIGNGEMEFSFTEAVELSGITPSALRRVLARGLERGVLAKFGASTRTRYYFNR